nr:NusG domain II-containing protein [uncultured Mediterraneibacter sp.]
MKKTDILLAAAILITAVCLLAFQLLRQDQGRKEAVITVAGETYGTYDMSADQVIEINDTNTLIIRDDLVQMEWADCPDQVCVNHRAIERNGESIICLPNQIVVSVESTEESELDGTTQ